MDTVTSVGDEPAHWGNYRSLKARIAAWVTARFGEKSLASPQERADRLLEEAMEFHQYAYRDDPEVGQGMVDGLKARVWSRPVGDPDKELAGVTLCALAASVSLKINLPKACGLEMDRIEKVPHHVTRAKHQEKVDARLGLTLPEAST